MPAEDKIHKAVRNALIKDGWTITDEPFTIEEKMDKRAAYAVIVRETISKSPYYVYGSKNKEIETELICDDAKGQYMLLDIGWRDGKRAFNPILYVRIKNDKIWIEEDWTENGITDDLLRVGVPKEDIVLAFHSPEMRPYTDFAVA